jgi:heme/copper-type cytochrome/quinol oxidase subunit 2
MIVIVTVRIMMIIMMVVMMVVMIATAAIAWEYAAAQEDDHRCSKH